MKLVVWILGLCVASLLGLGLVMLYSSTVTQVGSRYLTIQMGCCAVGLTVGALAAWLDYRLWQKAALPLVLGAVGLLVVVLVWGVEVNGARRWLEVLGLRFQPSEFAKLALIIAVAAYGAARARQMTTLWHGLVKPGAMIGVVMGLIFVEPDVGTAVLLGGVCSVMLLVAGTRWCQFLPIAAIVATGIGAYIWQNPTRSDRIYSWLHLEETKTGTGLQVYESLLALGSGGVEGLGLGNSRQKLGFIPFHHTDFIFPVVGEELGLGATLGIVTAFTLIVVCGVYIARHARDRFGMLLATGVAFLIGLQAFINIAVVTNVLPNKGLPLPFISRGGSNLVVMLVAVGLLLSVARHAHAPALATDEFVEPDPAPVPQTA